MASLADTNRFLKDPEARDTAIRRLVETSSAIEGIRHPFKTKGDTAAKPRAAKVKAARRRSPKTV
jgi:hypothetical protein